MTTIPTVDAAYFDRFNRDAETANRSRVSGIFRQVDDGPLTFWYPGLLGEIVEVTDQADMPFDSLVWDRMPAVRDTAEATGKPYAGFVALLGSERIVIEWYAGEPVAEPDNPSNPPTKPFSSRKIETTFLFAPPAKFHGKTVVASTYVPADFGRLPQHLVVFYTREEVHWAPAEIDGGAMVFGVGRVEYDDVEQAEITTPIGFSHMTYAEAFNRYAAELARALGARSA